MTANECIRGRRSIRKFTDQPVSHELLAQVVETASYAPSWKHTQIVRYIAVEGEKKAALAKCTAVFPGNGKIMDEAPMVIAVTIIKGRSGYERVLKFIDSDNCSVNFLNSFSSSSSKSSYIGNNNRREFILLPFPLIFLTI